MGQVAADNGVLALTFKDKAVLYCAYMPYLEHGGLFVTTAEAYRIGDEVRLLLQLLDEPEPIAVTGRVVWVTPGGAQGNRPAGIGLRFSERDAGAGLKIENHLAGALDSGRPTYTM